MLLHINILGLLISFLIYTPPKSSSDWVISLKLKEIKIEDRDFYIKSVSDKRQDSSNIGYLEGLWKNKTYLRLNGGAKKAFTEYLDKALPADSSQIPVELTIKGIKATNDAGWGHISAIVEMELEFSWLNKEGDLEKVEVNVIKEKENLIKIAKRTYRKLLRDVLVSSLNQLNNDLKAQSITP
ncbi:hypothetical protein [Catalinimonas niigatensis]|uniref:hypothetical protein n=1 Tax=Catalinimonas niigatensis TaxID=1397264 RepID=UPI002665EB0E|nr:hypothetical protein [Catalinimonas niigatensis]WPP51384.1 hypothetical protein PZB72_03160 [Catalinimonas niigatensis]